MSRVSSAVTGLLLAVVAACRDATPTGPQSPAVARASSAGSYELVDLGTLGGTSATATRVNDHRQVVGVSTTAGGASHAFLWDDGVMTDLGTLGGDWSEASDINASGQIAGRSTDASGTSHAFLWSDGVMQDLGPAVQYFDARLNSGGQVTWTAPMPDGTTHAVLWTGGVLQDLGTFGGTSQAMAINDLGQVVGVSNDRPFFWDGAAMQELASLGNYAWAADINNDGLIVGASYTPYPDPTLHALVWSGGQVTDLGTLPGSRNAHAVTLNARGQVAGVALSLGYEQGSPFRWEAGALTPLRPTSESGGRTEAVVAMNQRGVVVGYKTMLHSYQAVVSDNGARWDLPGLSALGTKALAINARGDVSGVADVEGGTHAVLWLSGLKQTEVLASR